MNNTSVWVYDDLWEEGYRFDDIVTNKFCFVEKKFANNPVEALDYLQKAYKFIPKLQGNSKPFRNSTQIIRELLLVVKE